MIAAVVKPRGKVKAQLAPLRTTQPANVEPDSPHTAAASVKATFVTTTMLQHACSQVNQAVALLDVLAQHADSQVCWGAGRLVDLAAEEIAKSIGTHDMKCVVEGRVILVEALAVLGMLGDMDPSIPVGGVITLLDLARNEIDEATERMQ